MNQFNFTSANAQIAGQKGAVNGVASLDSNGLVPNSQLPGATQSAAGTMSAADKTKLDGIATGATANVVSDSLSDTSTTNALSAAKGKTLNDSKVNREPSAFRSTTLNDIATSLATKYGSSYFTEFVAYDLTDGNPSGMYVAIKNGDFSAKARFFHFVGNTSSGTNYTLDSFASLDTQMTKQRITPTAGTNVTIVSHCCYTVSNIACINISFTMTADAGSTEYLVTGLPTPPVEVPVIAIRNLVSGGSQASITTSGALKNAWDSFVNGKTYFVNCCYAI